MTLTATDLKGKGKARDLVDNAGVESAYTSDVSGNDMSSDSDSDSSIGESDSESVTQEYLESLIAKAKAGVADKRKKSGDAYYVEEEEILILGEEDQKPLPSLDPGPSLPQPYFRLRTSRTDASSLLHDLEAEGIQQAAPSQPLAPPPPPELNKDGKPTTKRQRKEQQKATTGPDWFDLPAPAAADLPKLYREVEALRLRNSLDPKRFYRKEEGEAKGIKGLPKHFAIGTILPSSTPFGTLSADNLPRAHRKRTIVDELVDDAETKRYAKKKFLDLQVVHGERGRGTYARKKAGRRGKW